MSPTTAASCGRLIWRPFNVFDFDAWGRALGSRFLILIARRPLLPGERIGLVLTEGSAFQPQAQRHSRAACAALTGAKPGFGGGQALPPRPDRAGAGGIRPAPSARRSFGRWEAEGKNWREHALHRGSCSRGKSNGK